MGKFTTPVMRVDLSLDAAFYPYLNEIQEARVYGNFGPQVCQLEEEYASFLGVDAELVVSAVNATSAISGAMKILGAQRWLLPSWTFSATAHASCQVSEELVFGDVDPRTNVIVPARLEASSGAVLTAPFGSKIYVGAEWNGFQSLVIDAAAAIAHAPEISDEYRGNWATVYSLHATKVLGIGEGAIAVFSDREIAARFRMWTNFGFHGSRVAQIEATNAKLSEILAAVGRYRLSGWEREKEEWLAARDAAHTIAESLKINVHYSNPNLVNPYWIVQFESARRKNLVKQSLELARIESRDWWGSGCHEMEPFKRIRILDYLSSTEHLADTTLGLPFYRGISSETILKVGEVISESE